MKTIRLSLVGFGNVGQAFARLLSEKLPELESEYGFSAVVTGIATGRHGCCINPAGINLSEALSNISRGTSLTELNQTGFEGGTISFIRSCPADVMLETSPVNPISGQPALDHLRQALHQGMHIITANKGPVVFGYQELKELAASRKLGFRFESAVMDGAPIFSLFRHPLRGVRLLGFSGILNSCTNLLLDRMAQGESIEQAIAYGASIGITETDPSNDVDGWDAAIKVAALATVLMDHPLTPVQVEREGIRGITQAMIAEAAAEGLRWKLVCKAHWQEGQLITSVRPEKVGPDSPLYSVNGTSSFVNFELDVLPGLGILESNPSPKTTAFGMLADLIDLMAESK